MKIIIAGDGKVGATLTRQLSSEGYDVTIIDSKASPLESSVERYDVISVQGNCASMDVLRQAGVKDADLLIAATGADEVKDAKEDFVIKEPADLLDVLCELNR